MGWHQKALRVHQWFKKRLAPELRPPYFDYAELLLGRIGVGNAWLEVGCGHQILPDVDLRQTEQELAFRARLLVGIDLERASLLKHHTIPNRVRGDIGKLPFRDNSFDVVTANSVVEHLTHPAQQFMEIRRVLKPGGLFIFHTPNLLSPVILLSHITPYWVKKKLIPLVFGYAEEEDIFPTTYRANTEGGNQKIARYAGFEVDEIRLVTGCGLYPLILLLPVAIVEMLLLKAIKRYSLLRHLRSNIVGVLRKPVSGKPLATNQAIADEVPVCER